MFELLMLLPLAVFVAFTSFLFGRNGNLFVSWAAGFTAALIAATMLHVGVYAEAGNIITLFGLGSLFSIMVAMEVAGHDSFDEGNAVLLNREPCAGVSFRVSAVAHKPVMPQVRAA